MSDYRVKGTDLASVADAIRTKGGTSASLPFPDGFVSAVQNIPSGGGSTLISKTITENGTYNASSDNADGYSSVNVAISNQLMIGTFKGTATGSALAVNIPYTGNGYPVAGIIFPTGGTMSTDIAQLVHNNADVMVSFVKNDTEQAPTYNDISSVANKATMLIFYKSSSSDPANCTATYAKEKAMYQDSNASETQSNILRMKDNTTMSVYIANTTYGFPVNIDFTYMVIYSE